MNRRKSDVDTNRSLRAFVILSVFLSLQSLVVSCKAIRAMDDTTRFAADAYHLGVTIGRKPKFNPDPLSE